MSYLRDDTEMPRTSVDMSQQWSACFLSWAIPIFKALNEVAMNKSLPSTRRTIAMQIATYLGIAHHILKSVPVYWIEPEVDNLCRVLLDDFASMICVRLELTHRYIYYRWTDLLYICVCVTGNNLLMRLSGHDIGARLVPSMAFTLFSADRFFIRTVS